MDRSKGNFRIGAKINEGIDIGCGSFEVAPLNGHLVFEPGHRTILKIDCKDDHITNFDDSNTFEELIS